MVQKAEKTYGQASNIMEDYPLGINMMFVQPFNNVKGSAKALVTKLATYQQTNDKMLISSSWFGEMALEKSIAEDKFISLRQWLMSVNSLHQKTTRQGQGYHDRLFTSIHHDKNALETRFYFYKVNEVEAMNVISALPLFVRDTLNLDPACFFHHSDFKHILEGTWDKEKREYKDPNMINQEQYLMDLDDCFNVHREFFPHTIFTDTKETRMETEKHLAMANGEDDISILSSLTEKTLKAATKIPGTSGRGDDGMSVESGMTSKSKTQLAVRSALKEVSAEHHKAMEEQQKKFEREIAQLRQALEQNNAVLNQQEVAIQGTQDSPEALPLETDINNMDAKQEETGVMDLDDSSDDMASLPSTRRAFKKTSLSEASAALASPDHKRPKRSQSKSRSGQGGRHSSSNKSNV